MKTVFHSAESRGKANHGWLNARHSFSFARWQNPERMSFGLLRVLNDDIVLPTHGFDTHPHNDMEIITIPLSGALEHKDSMDHSSIIRTGEVQVMSAGTGVYHSEYNASESEDINLLQLWIFPREKGLKPRYDQKMYNADERKNRLQTVVNPESEGGLFIHQDAWLSLTNLDKNKSLDYEIKKKDNGVYIFVIEGKAEIAGSELSRRDAIGVWDTDKVTIKATDDCEILFIDVPMK